MIKKILGFFIMVSISTSVSASNLSITKKIEEMEKKNNIRIGISAVHIESGKSFNYRGGERFKMVSTVKLPVAIYLLDQINKDRASLRHMIRLEPHDLIPGSGQLGYFLTYPSLSISVHNLIESMMAISDNTSTDALIEYVGGLEKIRRYLKNEKFDDISIDNNMESLFEKSRGITFPAKKEGRELKHIVDIMSKVPLEKLRKSVKNLYGGKEDTTTPKEMTKLLIALKKGDLIGKDKSDMLLEIMSHCLDDKRMRGDLPKRVKVAHKTGSWDKNLGKGQNYGIFSDVGVIYLPNGKGHVAISLYTDSRHSSDRKKHFAMISKATRMIYDELL